MNDRYFKRKSEGILNVWDVARFGEKKAKKFDKKLLKRQRRVLGKRTLIKEKQNDNV